MSKSVPRKKPAPKKRPSKSTEERELNLSYAFEYGLNLRTRCINITGEISTDTFDLIDCGMSELETANPKSPITIKINSPGGSVYDALAIIGRIRASTCPVITEGYGAIMSAATIILASGAKRRISQFAWFMAHESSYGIHGRHSEVKAYVAQAESEEKYWAHWMEQFTKKDSRFWLKTGIGTDSYFSPEELVKLGVADEIF